MSSELMNAIINRLPDTRFVPISQIEDAFSLSEAELESMHCTPSSALRVSAVIDIMNNARDSNVRIHGSLDESAFVNEFRLNLLKCAPYSNLDQGDFL